MTAWEAVPDPESPVPSPLTSSPLLLTTPVTFLPYAEALDLQRRLARARSSGAVGEDVLLLVEHPPVVTLGRSSKVGNLTTPAPLLAANGVELYEVERGGDVTFHGPGQLVGYPIVDLKRHRKDLHWYLRQVEEALIRACDAHGLSCGRNPGFTGVWTGGRKLASIGVHAREWVTWHGFALNVCTNLRYFDLIVPCGIQDVCMTSLEAELGERSPSLEAFAASAGREFAALFELQAATVAVDELSEMASELETAG
jgi:lipoate-protein ligase B